mgnify:CR=1 FL=1
MYQLFIEGLQRLGAAARPGRCHLAGGQDHAHAPPAATGDRIDEAGDEGSD